MGPDHAHHHAPLYNCLRIRNQQFGKSFEWMITTVEMGCSNEWTKSFLSGLDDWVDLSLLLLLLLPAPGEWGQSFAFTSHHIVARCCTRKPLYCWSHQSLLICQVSPGRRRELLPDKCWIPAPWSPHPRNEMIIRATQFLHQIFRYSKAAFWLSMSKFRNSYIYLSIRPWIQFVSQLCGINFPSALHESLIVLGKTSAQNGRSENCRGECDR